MSTTTCGPTTAGSRSSLVPAFVCRRSTLLCHQSYLRLLLPVLLKVRSLSQSSSSGVLGQLHVALNFLQNFQQYWTSSKFNKNACFWLFMSTFAAIDLTTQLRCSASTYSSVADSRCSSLHPCMGGWHPGRRYNSVVINVQFP